MKRKGILFVFFAAMFCVLSACSSYHTAAPVSDATIRWHGGYMIHRVRKGETLYAIAWRYEKDYQILAEINRLKAPFSLNPGQVIYLNRSPYISKQKRVKIHHRMNKREIAPKYWSMPAKGKIVRYFSSQHKGIDISGHYGERICAAASGTVVYAGDGIRGYGNLVIIKHGTRYLTAYAYNRVLYVNVNQKVRRGQTIATMGRTDLGKVLLHFEIRLRGKPVNPMHYIKK